MAEAGFPLPVARFRSKPRRGAHPTPAGNKEQDRRRQPPRLLLSPALSLPCSVLIRVDPWLASLLPPRQFAFSRLVRNSRSKLALILEEASFLMFVFTSTRELR